jgi:2-polyprenyl-6-hydroxyphenyl methylase/3-demethylubiquinone-9 3-methyltransferase
MHDYYARSLSGERLRRCYEVASPRVRRYLEAEVAFVLERLGECRSVLELGCGYGRVAAQLAHRVPFAVGIDTARDNLILARRLMDPREEFPVLLMDARSLGFADRAFDAVVCIQNGICAFHVDPQALVREAVRATRRGGLAFFSTYAARFWRHRLDWFEAQAAEGLVGPIDPARTRDGTIVCTDGFQVGTIRPNELRALCDALGLAAEIAEVDASSLFAVIHA